MASPVAVQRRFSESGSASRGSSTSSGEDGEVPALGIRSAVVEVHPNASPNHLMMEQSPSPTPHHPTERDRGERRRRTPPTPPSHSDKEVEASPPPKRKKMEPDPLTTRTGGAYIPPARLRMMQEGITDKSSVAYQRIAWEALKKSINGLVNKVNVSNIANILSELFQENVVRGRGVLAQSIIRAQTASPMFTNVYAALVAIVNTKFPQTGELVATRLIVRFKKSFRRNDKAVCIATVKFLAHLVNQQVLHELVGLELLMLLLEEPSDDSVEVAVGFIKECGMKLQELTPKGLHSVFETLRTILHSGKIVSRVQYMIEVLFAIRKDRFQAHPAVLKELDLVNEDDQITHLLSLADEDYDPEDMLNVFRPDSDYLENEEKYKMIREEILGEGVGSGSSEEEGSDEDSDEEESEEDSDEEADKKMAIEDMTGANEKSVRRQIYLTIMSSLDFEECAHKLLKTMGEGHEKEIALMLVECCGQERSYLRFYGLLGQRLCLLNQAWVAVFDQAFQDQYETVHRLETNKLRNVAKFFGQLFYVDALPWTSMACIHLNEEETNSSSRIFIKILFQELAEFMGLPKLNEKLRDPMLSVSFEGLMPRDNPQNTRFAINFFTSIGLGGLTDDLREHLKNAQKLLMAQKQAARAAAESSSSSSSSSESSSEESSSSESSDAGRKRKRRREKERAREKRRRDEKEDRERRSKRDHRERRDEERRREMRRHQRREEEEKESRRSSSKRKEHRHRDRDSRK